MYTTEQYKALYELTLDKLKKSENNILALKKSLAQWPEETANEPLANLLFTYDAEDTNNMISTLFELSNKYMCYIRKSNHEDFEFINWDHINNTRYTLKLLQEYFIEEEKRDQKKVSTLKVLKNGK